MPGQTVEEMWATLCLLAESRCLMGASPFYFTPGSPLHAQEKGNPKIRLASQGRDPFFSARLTALDLECADFSREDVYTCFRLSRVINYIKAGLDIGHASGHPYFQPAEKVLASGNWYAESKHGNVPLPFSPRIKEIVHCTPMTIRGYKTSRSLRWEPHRNSSALL
jgi:hypothetical protein